MPSARDKQNALGRTKSVSVLLTAIALIGAAIVFTVSFRIVSDGLARLDTQFTFKRSREEWQRGYVLQAGETFLNGVWMTVEGGTRWQIARLWLQYSDTLISQNKLLEALQVCQTASKVLERYDDEGALSYRCFLVDEAIRYPTLHLLITPTPATVP